MPRKSRRSNGDESIKKVSRRTQYSTSTRKALIKVAEEMFTKNGYSGTSLDAIVAGARVTKGALYHHFTGKQAIFEAAFEGIEKAASKRIKKAIKEARDPWSKAISGLHEFLTIVQDPAYQRVVIQEGPAILGYERFRAQEERSTFNLLQAIVQSVLKAGKNDVSDEMAETFSRIFFGAMSAAGESVTRADDPKLAVARVEAAIAYILAGLQVLAESGINLIDPEPEVTEES